ncbi:MAG: phosphodiester glycosidase family protein [Candidatus Omnitrophica bacterium]|nr:phosphodiester glycosidase family protein [Candidatus Omnitrophota bacterium]
MPRLFFPILRNFLLWCAAVALTLGAVYGGLCLRRPPQTDATIALYPGITYQRRFYSAPRPIMAHIVEFDLTQGGFAWFVTPPVDPGERMTSARTARELAEQFHLQIAVNGSHFEPFRSEGPWDYYPHAGDPVDVMGYAVSDGRMYSDNRAEWPKFCFNAQQVFVCGVGQVLKATQAIAGGRLLLRWGNVSPNMDGPLPSQPLPRTVVGYNALRTRAWLVVVDGRQKGYSEGMSLFEMGEYMRDLGADFVLNLDGGGSTTLVIERGGRLRVMNAPYHTHIPMRERPVANALGVRMIAARQDGAE